MATLEAARQAPRSGFRWNELQEQRDAARFAIQRRNLQSMLQFRFPSHPGRFPTRVNTRPQIDWAINLGTNGTAPTMYPAKYSFDATFAQASSFYFNALGENSGCNGNTSTNSTPGTRGCAVKLSHAGSQ
jgi:hypothetical protein